MYPMEQRLEALHLLAVGRSLNSVSKQLSISRAAMREWQTRGPQARMAGGDPCPARAAAASLDGAAYAALFGFYLGDGCISPVRTYFVLRIACDAAYPDIIDDVQHLIELIHPEGKGSRVGAPGHFVVQNCWRHWACLFPQHGPGRKHERTLGMTEWQWHIVEEHPAAFLRGLFHSDGCRVNNWATQMVAGRKKRYGYGRWHFTNHSIEIQRWCCAALDLIEVPWRQSNWHTISVSTKAGVAKLDELIGPKS
jgi:hypothetical protein